MTRATAAARVAAYRLRAGRRVVALVCAAGVLVAAAQCLVFAALAARSGADGASSLADMLAFVLKGAVQPAPKPSRVAAWPSVGLPFAWLALVSLPHAACLAFCGPDDSALVASGSRAAHWLGRCAAALACVCAYWGLVVLTCCVAALACGGGLSLEACEQACDLVGFARETLAIPPYDVLPFLLCVVCVSCALAVAQLVLSELTGAAVAFAASAALLAGSVFAMTPTLLGNYLMAARSSIFVVGHAVQTSEGLLAAGLRPEEGLLFALALAGASIAAGLLVARRQDHKGRVRP